MESSFTPDPLLDDLDEVRRQIGAEVGGGLRELLAHYRETEKQFADRLVTREQLRAERAAEIAAERESAGSVSGSHVP